MNEFEKIDYWIEISNYDLETAEAMLATKRLLYVGFMCHQVIEKILKAVFVMNCSAVPPFTHSLIDLAQKSNVYGGFSTDQKDLIDILQPLNIRARYPTYKDKLFQSLNYENCQIILSNTKALAKWIQTELLKK